MYTPGVPGGVPDNSRRASIENLPSVSAVCFGDTHDGTPWKYALTRESRGISIRLDQETLIIDQRGGGYADTVTTLAYEGAKPVANVHSVALLQLDTQLQIQRIYAEAVQQIADAYQQKHCLPA